MQMKQQTLALAAQQNIDSYRKPTRHDEFLKTMEAIVPWAALCEVIEPFYPKAGNGRPPSGWSACCASTLFSTGSTWQIWRVKKLCTTV